MRRYYTRVCNFYYGNESRLLVNSNRSIPLNGNKNISFDHIEIISRTSKKKISINKINSLAKSLKKLIIRIKVMLCFQLPEVGKLGPVFDEQDYQIILWWNGSISRSIL